MIIDLLSVGLGVLTGIITGVVPGVGITVAMVIASPILLNMEIIPILLFYIALASTVQFTGTVPSVFFGIPGESNSIPASIEGPKFARHKHAMLAIGACGVSSVIGSAIAVLLTTALLFLLVPYLQVFFNGALKFALYSSVIVFLLIVYNKRNFLANILLCVLGFALALPGESMLSSEFRYTFGINDLKYGIPLLPVLIGFIVVPTLFRFNNFKRVEQKQFNPIGVIKILEYVRRNIRSVLRGSVIGYFCGFIPGVSTTLSTNVSYSVEKKLNPRRSGRQLISAESANNSGSLACLLPLLLLGIPITGSEVILYGLLVEAGWNPLRFTSVEQAVTLLYSQLSGWYLIINVLALIAAWPFAKTLARLINSNYKNFMFAILALLFVVNGYIGYDDYRFWFFQICFVVFCVLGYLLRHYNCLPLVFMFIIAQDLEAVSYRLFVSYF